ncbi:MAG: hypothetical protein WA477_20400 [Candidatus Sulfotelmatobacter sp.]
MELLLNLAWLLLALPAYWLWRGSRTAQGGRKFTAAQGLLALGCLLVMLFPVVSATDDLRAMRAEMEESPTSKRSIAQSSNQNPSATRSQVQPALAVHSQIPALREQGRHLVVATVLSTPASHALFSAVRGPPRSLIG